MTLACEDGRQVGAHKVVLIAPSTFFEKILIRNQHPHPLIYIKGGDADLRLSRSDQTVVWFLSPERPQTHITDGELQIFHLRRSNQTMPQKNIRLSRNLLSGLYYRWGIADFTSLEVKSN